MQPSLMQTCSGKLLLLLVSNLLLCGNANVTSAPTRDKGNRQCNVSLQELFKEAITVSAKISKRASVLFAQFDRHYTMKQQFQNRAFGRCHTHSLGAPQTKKDAAELPTKFLMKLMPAILNAWKKPLYHLVTELSGRHGAPSQIVNMVRYIEEKCVRLQGVVGRIKIKLRLHYEEKKYPEWSGLAALQSADTKDARFAFYNLLHCLRSDMQKVHNYLHVVKCEAAPDQSCKSHGRHSI
ncbi:prolactin-like [Nannospalax galili]|uniref:prolactin-like n=1 Tax=Nannospalax galili TaxID=1026970 RepID=UPI000819A678|nr:prolactin-like [Nannospalax galili]